MEELLQLCLLAKNPSHIKGFGPEIDGFDQVPI